MQPEVDSLSLPSRPLLPEAVYRQLLGAILNGVFRPGQMLRQEEIAARLGVSRGPLREALPRLEAEGIVILHPRRGYTVTSLDPAEIDELFDLRMELETKLASFAIARRGPADIANVQRVNLALGELVALIDVSASSDRIRWFDLNFELHDALLAPAGLKQHMRILTKLRSQIEPYIRMEVYLTGDLDQSQSEHNLLVAAFVRGEAERFVTLTRDHVLHTRERLMRGLKQTEWFANKRDQ
jgi:DNA-binding GntR family transcriptional regulator